MKYPMKLKEFKTEYEWFPSSQYLSWDYDNFKGSFHVCNLCECPEDAIIGRDLFTAEDFIMAVKFGINLAQKGYTDIEVINEKSK